MGLTGTKEPREQTNQQERDINYMMECLHHHRDIVYSIAHSVNAFQAQVEVLLINMRNESHTLDEARVHCLYEDNVGPETVQKNKSITDDMARSLLCSIQDSLQCQSSALQTSFKVLNNCIHAALNEFRPDREGNSERSGVSDFSRKWLVYRNCPDPPIRDIQEELECQNNKNKHLQQCIGTQAEEIDGYISREASSREHICSLENKIESLERKLEKMERSISSNMSLLIFHHKDIHALPYQLSDRVLTGPEFKTLGGIFDLGFLPEKGIYDCEMNQNAANGLVKFVRAGK